MKKLVIIFMLSVVYLTLNAESANGKNGEYGFKMLKILSSPAQGGTANAILAVENDAAGFINNPAYTLFSAGRSATAIKNLWLFDTEFNTVAISSNHGSNAVGLAMRYLDYGKIKSYDESANNIGDFTPLDADVCFNFAQRAGASHYFGLNARILYEKLQSASAYGFSADFGYIWVTPVNGLKTGFTLKNFGKGGKMNSEEVDIAKEGDVFVAQKLQFENISVSSEVKANYSEDDSNLKPSLGVNVTYNEFFSIRGGYRFNHDLLGLSLGMGINYRRLSFDYAYLCVDNDLDDVHMFGLTYRF